MTVAQAARNGYASHFTVTDATQATDDIAAQRLRSSGTSASSVTSHASDTSGTSASSVTHDEENSQPTGNLPAYDPLELRRFLPAKKEFWKSALFKLARHTTGRADAEERFREWCDHVDTGLSRDELKEEWAFCKMNVKHPPRIFLADVLKRSEAHGIPKWIVDAAPESTRFQAVLAFLWELQEASFPQENFFVSTRDMGALFRVSAQWSSRALRFFAIRGIIEIVERGGPHNQKATRYRFASNSRKPK